MNTIKELYQTCKGKRVLVRIDANLHEDTVGRATPGISLLRIERSIDTIRKLSAHGAKVILATHLGDDGSRSTEDLIPLFELYEVYVGFFKKLSSGLLEVIEDMEEGEILLLQNTRSLDGEMSNSSDACEFFASLCDVFVNDAFSASHRNHASVVGVSHLRPSYLGEGLLYELAHINEFQKTTGPLGVIMAGNKLSTKLPLVNKFLTDENLKFLFLGGALAHPVYEARGISIGNSLTDRTITANDIPTDQRLIVSETVITKNSKTEIVDVHTVDVTDSIFDVSPEFIKTFAEQNFKNVKRIFWNGPLGNTPEGFTQGTLALIEELLKLDIHVIIGGGDTLDILPNDIMTHKNIFVSTGGGALLDYLSDGTLVGVEGKR